MTFATLASWQGWLLLLGAGAMAAALFLIKLRPPRILIPSSRSGSACSTRRLTTRWEKIRRAVSLIVTVAIAIALGSRSSAIAPGGAGAAGRGRTPSFSTRRGRCSRRLGTRDEVDRAIAEAGESRRRRSKSPSRRHRTGWVGPDG
jgi:hypothetical protein